MNAARGLGPKLGQKPALMPQQVPMAACMIDNAESPRGVARSLKLEKAPFTAICPARIAPRRKHPSSHGGIHVDRNAF